MSSDKTVSSWLAAGLLAAAAALVIQTVDPAIAAAEPLTVKRVIAIALENNPELLAARQEIENSRAREVKAHYLNQFNPQVEGGASNAHFEYAPYGNEPQPTGSVSLEVEVAGQRAKRIEQADKGLAKAKADFADAERLTQARAEYAFYQALYFRQRLDLAERVEDLNRRLRDASVVRFHSGESPIQECRSTK